METFNLFIRKKLIIFKWLILCILFQTIALSANSQVAVEVDAGLGYSIVNLDNYTYWKDGYPYDRSILSRYVTLQAFYNLNEKLSFGASVGYQHLFNYTMSWSDQWDDHYSNFFLAGFRIAALARFYFENNFIDVGPGLFRYEDYSAQLVDYYMYNDLFAVVGFGHLFKLSDQISVPVKINCNVIFDSDAIIVPFTVGAGVFYKIN